MLIRLKACLHLRMQSSLTRFINGMGNFPQRSANSLLYSPFLNQVTAISFIFAPLSSSSSLLLDPFEEQNSIILSYAASVDNIPAKSFTVVLIKTSLAELPPQAT